MNRSTSALRPTSASTSPAPLPRRQFASDNYAGICPEAWEALADANRGHAPAYGDDAWTARAADLIREVLETDCEVFFTFNGTAANSLALASLCQSYHSIICSEAAHVETDECGAPEFYSNGTKLLLARSDLGKLQPATVAELVEKRSDIHYPKPRALSVSQTTETGTLYSPNELQALGETARRFRLRMHMDGARLANAVAALGVKPREITWQAGVDVLCLGGTKQGSAVGDAVVFFDRDLAHEFDYRCKQAGQLASKMRFLAAPWVGMLQSGAWLRHAEHANRLAQVLATRIAEVPGVRLAFPCQANAVFVKLSPQIQAGLKVRGWRFYNFIGDCSRLMCAWDTTAEDVEALVSDLRELASG